MGIERGGLKGFRTGWTVPPKPCDSCKLASAALFCRPDSAFLCIACDSKIHCANKLASRHERVWMCEVCEQAPAAVTCKADAAALCVTCDSDIHSANPLARRHERVPVEPFLDSADSIVKASVAASFGFIVPSDDAVASDGFAHDDADAAAWLIPNPDFGSKLMDAPDIKSKELFFAEMDPFLDFDYSNSFQNNHNHNSAGNDSVVPVQTKPAPALAPLINHQSESCFDIDFCRSKLSSFNYPSQSLSQSVSSSSLDVGVVPDGNTVSEISYSMGRNGSDVSGGSSGQGATQLCGMDREARVLRYREKRKNRKFEKTIRYASRKAYAETRPRIKGRFAKRTEIDSDVERLYSPAAAAAALMLDTPYGVVPSF
ncbi:zinc finger protein CONSTANS-LIKE 5 [Abrus precatorius]|uniref:Zinc finger protein CONSTANS-LIKE 5 n=1 Tax=Abrus precatorius TaxID=3816 RepID=A0A8B8JIL5_ABRPR|nr:zinc finger protein CONSTANS-LIKE 5 [Abrus precatorius]XP_027331301.1 zinc finger protein CONSTANS-LIKE 5 [Abrus precatorius]